VLHPAWLRCSPVKYCRYSWSAQLALAGRGIPQRVSPSFRMGPRRSGPGSAWAKNQLNPTGQPGILPA